MKRIALLLAFAASVAAQTPAPKPATAAAKPPVKRPAAVATNAIVKLPVAPASIPKVKGVIKPAFELFYEDFKIGDGKLAEPGKVYKVHYTGWLASDGAKFDSSYDHRQPVMDKDGKPEKEADGNPKLGEAQPLSFPQGRGRLIPGWDQGFEGMKVGGKRRLFIPYQLAYGAAGRPPKIPAKSNLIFDVELVDVVDMPNQPTPGMPGGRPMPPRPAPGANPGSNPSSNPNSNPGGGPGATPAPPTGAAPGAPTLPPATPKPVDPTAPTVAPNSAPPPPTPIPPATTPAPATPPSPAPSPAPEKPANPAQPN